MVDFKFSVKEVVKVHQFSHPAVWGSQKIPQIEVKGHSLKQEDVHCFSVSGYQNWSSH